jgi:hypothetical protein
MRKPPLNDTANGRNAPGRATRTIAGSRAHEIPSEGAPVVTHRLFWDFPFWGSDKSRIGQKFFGLLSRPTLSIALMRRALRRPLTRFEKGSNMSVSLPEVVGRKLGAV